MPLTPTTIQIPNNATAIIQYTVTNNSTRPHTLMMLPIPGVKQVTTAGNCAQAFKLNSQQACILTLIVSGNQIPSHLVGGPKVCQQVEGRPSPLLCYQPSAANTLNITAQGAQVATLYAGMQSGFIYYSVNGGTSWNVTSSPSAGSAINSVVATTTTLYVGGANGQVYSSFNKGQTWTTIATPAPGFAVNGVQVATNNKLYIASAKGVIYICALNGTSCVPTNAPAPGEGVTSVFATSTALYAGSTNGGVYYSTNNGRTWSTINGQPDGSPINTIYLVNNTLYVGTANEYVYTSTSLTGGGSWSTYAQTVYSLFVNSKGPTIFAGTQGGYVFSLSTGNEVGFITYNPINSVFFLG